MSTEAEDDSAALARLAQRASTFSLTCTGLVRTVGRALSSRWRITHEGRACAVAYAVVAHLLHAAMTTVQSLSSYMCNKRMSDITDDPMSCDELENGE